MDAIAPQRRNTRPVPFELPPLPYPYDALAPTMDELTLRIHHDKHHGGYVTGLNAALEGSEWAERDLGKVLGDLDLMPEATRAAVRTNAGGHLNHSLFWEVMAPDGEIHPTGPLRNAIEATFESVPELKRQLSAAGNGLVGSGWAWLVYDGTGLAVTSTASEDSPLMNGQLPLLGIDLWEHAYNFRYQNRRDDYLEAWWYLVDWRRVGQRYATATGQNHHGQRLEHGEEDQE